MESWRLQRLLLPPLLLILQLASHVLLHQLLLGIEDFEAVLHRHLPLQVMTLTEESSVLFLATQLKRRNIDALKALFERLERFGEGKKHEDAL